MWLRAVARTLPGCSGVGKQLHGGNGGGAVSDTGGSRRTGQDRTGSSRRGELQVVGCCVSSAGHEQRRGMLRVRQADDWKDSADADQRVGLVFVLWRMIGYVT